MAQTPDQAIKRRVPPQNQEAEVAVLCCCLDSVDALSSITSALIPEDFYVPAHQLIYDTILKLYAESKSVDLITVGDELKRQGLLEKVGGMTYLSTIMDVHALVSNHAEYVKIVRQKAMSRRLIKQMEEVTRLSYEGETDANNLIEIAISRLAELRDHNKQDTVFQQLKTVIAETVHDIRNPKKDESIKSHFTSLDWVTNGFRPGTLTIVAARPAMGKSAFVINIAANVAIKDKRTVAFFSLEMSAKEIANRILSSRCDISTSSLQAVNKLTRDEIERIRGCLPLFGNTKLFIDDHSGLNTAEMLTRCRELKNQQGELSLVCIDYLQLMTPVSTRASSSRQQEISEISRALKLMAKELQVPIIALSQLSREADKRDDHRPVLSDLRDSGAIEQDADMVMFIHRPDYYKQKNDDNDEDNESGKKFKKRDEEEIQKAEIIVAKNRQGPTKTVYLSWNGSRTTFFEKDKPNPHEAAMPSDYDAPPEGAVSDVLIPDDLFADPIPDLPLPEEPAADSMPAEDAAFFNADSDMGFEEVDPEQLGWGDDSTFQDPGQPF
ncbi:MAG: replicative DNA helicase [Clostridiales bacterium]|nr:replicative DNA helicase [Clostridiales bacterium]